MRRLRPRRLTAAVLAASLTPPWLTTAASSGAAEAVPDLVSGEIEALRAALDVETDIETWQRVEIGARLELRWDSRRLRQRALESVVGVIPGVTPAQVESLRRRNREKLPLWPDARFRLGQRADRRIFLIADPSNLHVQFARIGWSSDGRIGLVYFELRPRDGAEAMRIVLRRVERVDDGWRVAPERLSLDRGEFVRETGIEP